MTKILLLLFFGIVEGALIHGQNQLHESKNQAEISETWELLTVDNYKIKHPPDWEVDRSGQVGTSFIIFSPLSGEIDKFSENVNLLVQDLTGYNLDLDQYVEISENQINTMFAEGKLYLSERISKGERTFQKMIYSGNQGDLKLKFEQYYWVIGDKAYVLTFTAEIDQFDKYQRVGEEILNSFKMK